MTNRNSPYLMESTEEAIRLERKTDHVGVREQAEWCGVRAGLRVLDAGCGSGVVTSILHAMIQPGGAIVGVDRSEERIQYAKEHYGSGEGIDFVCRDVRNPMEDLGEFDLIWVRLLLEYYREGSQAIVSNLTECLKPGGCLCLIDLDHNPLNYYGLPEKTERTLYMCAEVIQKENNFDPYAGRKLYAYLYDLGYTDIRVELKAHQLIYGEISDDQLFNWVKKVQVGSLAVKEILDEYPGGYDGFFHDFVDFLKNPRRFIYLPLILCRGTGM